MNGERSRVGELKTGSAIYTVWEPKGRHLTVNKRYNVYAKTSNMLKDTVDNCIHC